MVQKINATLTAQMKRNIELQFHPHVDIDETTKRKVCEDALTNVEVIMATIDLAEDKCNSSDYEQKLRRAGFKVEESVQFFPIREGTGDDEEGDWELPVNVEENDVLKHKNLLCVTRLGNAYLFLLIPKCVVRAYLFLSVCGRV